MGSVSIFIDAGYLFKQGSEAVLGAKLKRQDIVFAAEQFVHDLDAWVCQLYPSDGLLRTYWYDGAKRGVPTASHLEVAALSFVKLRLGRINSAGEQKGVDTLIVRDLMVLSQERSISRAMVLSGDEDLREGIEYAQDRGVRVAVVGIEANGRTNQSVELVREADQSLLLPQTITSASISQRTVTTPTAPPAVTSVGEADDQTHAGYVEVAIQFATDWLSRANSEEVAALNANSPRIPPALDASLLRHTCEALSVQTVEIGPKRAVRKAFWRAVETYMGTTNDGTPS